MSADLASIFLQYSHMMTHLNQPARISVHFIQGTFITRKT